MADACIHGAGRGGLPTPPQKPTRSLGALRRMLCTIRARCGCFVYRCAPPSSQWTVSLARAMRGAAIVPCARSTHRASDQWNRSATGRATWSGRTVGCIATGVFVAPEYGARSVCCIRKAVTRQRQERFTLFAAVARNRATNRSYALCISSRSSPHWVCK